MEPTPNAATPILSRMRLSAGGHVLALLVLVGSVALVFALWRAAYQRELRTAQLEFVNDTVEVADAMYQRMVNYELLTRGGAALFGSIKRPSPQQWYAYVEGMDIQERFPAVVGFGFAGYLRQERLDDLLKGWEAAEYGQLKVLPEGEREFYGPILYLEPKTPENLRAIGYDMFSEPTRHDAMRQAMVSSEARLSGPVQLVQDGITLTTAVLLYLPVYRDQEQHPASVSERQQAMQGWVYVPVRLDRFVEQSLGDDYQGLRLQISDVTGGKADSLFRSPDEATDAPPAFQNSIEVLQYGRRWRLDFESSPEEIAVPGLRGLHTMLALGLFACLLMYAVVWALARTESRARDIARRMTEDFRRSELRFRTAMDYSAIGQALLDSEGRIVEANAALGRIVGRPQLALVGERFDSLFEDDDIQWAAFDGVPSGPDGVSSTTRRLHRKGGEPRHAQLTYAPVPGNIGEDIAGLVQAEDVSDRVRAQARVQALNKTLETRVELRTRELRHANQELETFAYSVSHDLRAPLRAIDGFSKILGERYADVLDEGGQGYLDRVRGAARRMGELIEALLKMSRVTRSELTIESVDLSRLAAESLEELATGEEDRRVCVDIEPDMQVQGDVALLRNLLDNLIGNAWKFTREREHAEIELGRSTNADGEAEFFVRDNGAGFSQDYVEKLFLPFQRLHAESQFAGHGIGLASVKRIVDRHGGHIRAEGREGEGATFYFTLPGANVEH